MKENTKQILKVSICTLMALVLFAGVILMCIYFAFDNTNDGVADAYTDEEVGVSNLDFTVDRGFYVRNFWEDDISTVESLINYYFYFIPNAMESDADYNYTFQAGTITITYRETETSTRFRAVPIWLCLYKFADSDIVKIDVYIDESSRLDFFGLYYDYLGRYIDDYYLSISVTQSNVSPYNFYADFFDIPDAPNTFGNDLATAVFGNSQEIYSINSLLFEFYSFINLGIFISPNETFANPPVVMPESVYNGNMQDNYDEGYGDAVSEYEPTIEDLQNQINQNNALIEQLRDEIRYYESLDLNLSTIDVFNPSRMKSSTFVYDGVTYTSNSIVSTDDGWDVYSSTYHNEELPPNYGVGFSLFLPESITNTKFYVYGDITGWYNYTYCSEPDEQGNQQCYQVSDMIATISVGYRNQNGNIVKVGTFTSNLPGAGGVDFFIDSPTNEIVFFVENCNLMEVDRNTQVIYYYFDTESIYNDGYENGKSQGIKVGREEGYYEGVADANDYSFFSLFTSVFDAPITAIVGKWGDSDGDGIYEREGGMLNFYIPGLDINFAPFLLSLFTIAIIILVIRFVMARKS